MICLHLDNFSNNLFGLKGILFDGMSISHLEKIVHSLRELLNFRVRYRQMIEDLKRFHLFSSSSTYGCELKPDV